MAYLPTFAVLRCVILQRMELATLLKLEPASDDDASNADESAAESSAAETGDDIWYSLSEIPCMCVIKYLVTHDVLLGYGIKR